MTSTQVQSEMASASPTTTTSSKPSTFPLLAPLFPPKVAYAEDQPYAKATLTTHVLNRGFQTGAFIGIGTALVRTGLQARTASTTPVWQTFKAATPAILRTTGAGAMVGMGLMAAALPLRMRGRDDIEWKDRAYRLAHNANQREVDQWAIAGEVGGGAGAYYLHRAGFKLGALGVLGGMALGNALAVEDFVIWRHVIRGGKRSGDDA